MKLPPTVTITEVRCPRAAEHATDKNVRLLMRPDNTLFCALHGDVNHCGCGAEIGADGERGPVCDAGHDVLDWRAP